jgi:hypothetical protein
MKHNVGHWVMIIMQMRNMLNKCYDINIVKILCEKGKWI